MSEPPPTPPAPPSGRRRLGRIFLSLISLFLTLGFLEVALRLTKPAPPPAPPIAEGEGFVAPDAELGWVHVAGAEDRDRSDEFDIAVRINGAGHREDREYGPDRAPGRGRVVAIGDSFTFGYGVEEAEGYTAILEDRLGDTDVINTAVSGYGTDQQLLLLRDQGLAYRPDVVLLGLFAGNVFRNARHYQLHYPKPRFELAADGSLRFVPPPRGDDSDAAEAPSYPSEVQRLLATHGRTVYQHLGYGEAWPLTAAIVRDMAARSRAVGAELLVVIIPKDRAIEGTGVRRRIHHRTMAAIRTMLEREGIAYVDTTAILEEWVAAYPDEPVYFAHDGHWNVRGHRVVGEALAGPVREMLTEVAGRRAGGRAPAP